jgi:hypothetical protein
MTPKQDIIVTVEKPDHTCFSFLMIARLDTAVEIEYYMNGGILPTVLSRLVDSSELENTERTISVPTITNGIAANSVFGQATG